MIFKNKRILITGGTGSLGHKLAKHILSFEEGRPKKVIIFSRDEEKQHQMRLEFKNEGVATDEVIYKQASEILEFMIGDVRNPETLHVALKDTDIVINAAALKQVPTCEYFPMEAVSTNILGANNIASIITRYKLPVEIVVGVSTDKACKPVNIMGMTKSIQERILIEANLKNKKTRFICVRYGNVLISRGSVIPLFFHQINAGGPVTITDPEMTRFLMSLDQAVSTIFDAIKFAQKGETYIPKVRSARIVDIADVLIGDRNIKKKFTSIRPGEKMHEILISEEEIWRTVPKGRYFAIQPTLPELRVAHNFKNHYLKKEYSSADDPMTKKEVYALLKKNGLLLKSDLSIREGV
jgi:UDP-glucose 4-epimerase